MFKDKRYESCFAACVLGRTEKFDRTRVSQLYKCASIYMLISRCGKSKKTVGAEITRTQITRHFSD